jgi:predicted N-acetyltransferase YhbS
MAKLMPDGTKCMFICTLSVDPEYASHGVGSALMEWGTRIADEDKIFCWVHASDGSHMFYGKHGFETVGELTVDPDEFATQPAPDDGGTWGQYTFRYMKRLPRNGQTKH